MKTQPLQRQFRLWTALLVIVPSLLIMGIYTIAQLEAVTDYHLDHINQRVSSQERLIDYWMEERLDDVRRLSRLNAFRTLDQSQMKQELALIQHVDDDFASLSYINKDGQFKMSTLSQGITHPSAVGKPYYQEALAGKEYISGVVIGRNSGLPIINFSAPIYDASGKFQGLILGSVRTTTLETLLDDNLIGRTGEILLVNQQGTMLIKPRYAVNNTTPLKISDDAFRHIQLGQNGTATWVDYHGKKVLGVYRYMPERHWTLIGKINETEFLLPIYKQLGIMTGSTFLLLLFIMPVAAMLTNNIKQPIDWLIQQSHLVAAENYEQVGQDRSFSKMPHEINTLCETFIHMSRKIQNHIYLLKEHEAKLENNVIEIQSINAALAEEIVERQEAQEALRQLNIELENIVQKRVQELQDINAALEEEIMERQKTQEALMDSQNALLLREQQLKYYADEVAATNTELKSFANIIAHDFRTPMVNLKGFSHELGYSLAELQELIGKESLHLPQPIQAKVDELLEKDVPDAQRFISAAVDRLSRMVDALLNLARLGRRDMTYREVAIGQLVNNVLRSFQHQIEQTNTQVQVDWLPTIHTDELAMEQIISNLLDNALKYLDPGRSGKIKISCTSSSDKYRFSVKDNGCGIAAGDLDKIFEIFRRSGNPNIAGEGMGLAYVRTLIRQLGGKVWCQSQLGAGTTMHFTVPKNPN